jgi:hypothetical protein
LPASIEDDVLGSNCGLRSYKEYKEGSIRWDIMLYIPLKISGGGTSNFYLQGERKDKEGNSI